MPATCFAVTLPKLFRLLALLVCLSPLKLRALPECLKRSVGRGRCESSCVCTLSNPPSRRKQKFPSTVLLLNATGSVSTAMVRGDCGELGTLTECKRTFAILNTCTTCAPDYNPSFSHISPSLSSRILPSLSSQHRSCSIAPTSPAVSLSRNSHILGPPPPRTRVRCTMQSTLHTCNPFLSSPRALLTRSPPHPCCPLQMTAETLDMRTSHTLTHPAHNHLQMPSILS
jgi:hypothetical protein